MNVYAIGASRNIGYYASVRLLEKGATVTMLLRSPSTFDHDSSIQSYVKSGKARLVKGDALNAADVQRGWESAMEASEGRVDLVLFSVGGTPKFSITKGFVIDPPNLCTKSLLNVLSTVPAALRDPITQPRFITISSIGLTRASHDALPLALKPMYGYLLRVPHLDKVGAERIVAHCAGRTWTDEEPQEEIIGRDWKDTPGLLGPGELKHVVVVRPALLTDGACKADKVDKASKKPPYRAADGELGDGYTVSRRDIAHFLVEGVLLNWDQWEGKCVSVAY
ncbi:hypothetical protein AcV5_006607 [Taiwanofungus camphoratus]|nr:hypothetical protein AcV5_006607 [Antrodia cinnamomea]KAI0949794.1 hypothetical protein AcV7_008458 [Antrodia cinnamomea]